MDPNVIALAVEIADSAARSDVEIYCAHVRTDGEPGGKTYRHWYDTQQLDDIVIEPVPKAGIDQAVRYLDMRGLLMRDSDEPHVVSFVKRIA